MKVEFEVNGERRAVDVDPVSPLSTVLRRELKLYGTKRACERGKCGACTVIVDGNATKSCLRPAAQAAGSSITTIEGLSAGDEALHPVQEAFIENFGFQCGYCTPGIVMMTTAFLASNPDPDRREARSAMDGNLCRCTGYTKILDSIVAAAERMDSGGDHD